MRPLALDDDRALPDEPRRREVARVIYAETRSLPLVCMHGHVEPVLLADDLPFADPADLLVSRDHYVLRMIVSQGVPLHQLGVASRAPGAPEPAPPREVWRTFCSHWHLFRGTPTRYWIEHELAQVLGVTVAPSAESADPLYDELTARLAEPAFRPRALFEQFGIEVLATTDSALSSLDDHRRLAGDAWGGRVIPTFRPDALVHIGHEGWPAALDELAACSDVDTGDYAGFVEALRRRRLAFVEAGATATDHGHTAAGTSRLTDADASRLFSRARRGEAASPDEQAFAANMLHVMAEMSCDDGLVMQLHPTVMRDHDRGVTDAYGPNLGYDIPVSAEFTRSLRPLLESFGHHPRFRLIAYTVDETTYSRELAPLAGVYPALRLGAPWWFLDSPDGMRRFRELVTDTAGFYNTAGFVDDTRAFCSIPARHDLARRIDAGFLARLVTEHRLEADEAVEVAVDLAYHIPRKAFRLDGSR
jgi:glucuronate isomerase